jgi:hypothetical protein
MPVEGCFEHGNKPSVYVKCSEVLEKLHGWLLPEKGSDP